MAYRPLPARGQSSTSFDTLHEGIPAWLLEPVRAWLRPFIRSRATTGGLIYHADWMRNLQARMHLEPPLPWHFAISDVAHALEERVARNNGEVGLDIIDYVLHHRPEARRYGSDEAAQEIAAILLSGGSAWEVTPVGNDGSYSLTRRAVGPVREAIDEIMPVTERAGRRLTDAWRYLASRDPIPDQAYFQALMAVEAAAKPIVSPRDGDATLGKMLRAVRDAPQKFRFVLGDVSTVVPMMEAMWTTHVRHGTDDREAPMGMSQDEADAGVHTALTLVRWFVGGAITRD